MTQAVTDARRNWRNPASARELPISYYRRIVLDAEPGVLFLGSSSIFNTSDHVLIEIQILDILLFCFFTVMLAVRYITHPTLINKNITEFPSSSYFGAIPIVC